MRTATRTRRRRLAIALALGATAALLPVTGTARPAAAALANVFDFPCSSSGPTTGDFNADGLQDLAIGAPGDNLEQTEVDGSITRGWDDAGSINVVYSTRGGGGIPSGLAPEFRPTPGTRIYFSQNTPGIQETAEVSDNFGFVLAAGNFDGSGGDDLAIGVPGENNGRGAIHVLYSGGREGLAVGTPGQPSFNQFIHQNTAGVDGTAEDGDHFGYALAAGFINDDAYADLVIGVPNEAIGTIKDAGMIHVIYGSPTGLNPNGPDAATNPGRHADQTFQQGPGQITRPEVGRAEPGDLFGAALTVGQFNDDPREDVAVGSPGEDVRSVPDGGGVSVLYSLGADGLSTVEKDFFTQQTDNVDGISEAGDRMGCSLDAGDFDGDGDQDLAIGVPGEGVGPNSQAGVVQILYNTGTVTGISQVPDSPHPSNSWIEDQVWDEDEGGIPGVSKQDDRMGSSLASGDFDGDGVEDLAIGLPTELLYTNNRSGSVRVLYGFGGYGLTDGTGGGGVPGGPRCSPQSNATDPCLPIAFAQSPSDLPSSCLLYGLLNDPLLRPIAEILFGPCTVLQGLTGVNDYSPLLMIEEEGDHFGASIAAGDFDGNGRADLAIGSPGEDLGLFVNWLVEEEATIPDELLPGLLPIDEADDAGVVNVVYGPFPSGTASPPPPNPDKQDLIYREGNSPFVQVRSLLHSLLGFLLQDNQIHPRPADPSASRVLEGDNFGQDGS